MKRGPRIFCAVVQFLVLFGTPVLAQTGKIGTGNLKVLPGLTIEGVYDDNIYLGNGTNTTTEDKKSDWITHVKPSLFLDYLMRARGNVRLGFDGDSGYYHETDFNNWVTYRGHFALDYKAPGGLSFGLNNEYTNAEDPYGSENQYNLGVPLTKRWSNDLNSKIGFEFANRLRILGYYNFYKQDYEAESDFTQDYEANEFGGGFQVRLMPKTWGFARYHYGERDYITHPVGSGSAEANDADFHWQRVNVGLTWEAEAKLNGELNFGYEWKRYENPTDPSGNPYKDRNTWIAATLVTWQATETTRFTLTISRALRDVSSNTNEYFEDTGGSLTWQQVILTRFTMTAGGSYAKNDYNLPIVDPRQDDLYKARMDLTYQIRDWIRVGAGYKYDRKDSNKNENDYTDHQFMVSLGFSYE